MGSSGDYLHLTTPLVKSYVLSLKNDFPVYLKLENVQVPGSFKIRGIGNMCVDSLKLKPNAPFFVCSSGGNAGLAASYAGMLLNKPVHVFVPTSTPEFVLQQFKLYPASHVHVHGEVWNEANEKAQEFCKSVGGIFIPPYDHPLIWTGHSTLIDEAVDQLGRDIVPSCIVVSVGGGGLLMGVLEGIKRHPAWKKVPVLAMETEGADCLAQSIKNNKIVRLNSITSAAKSLGALEPCYALWKCLESGEGNVISEVMSDDQAIMACRQIMQDHRYVVETACGAALSAVYGDTVRSLNERKAIDVSSGPVIVVVCGGVSVQSFL